LDAGLLLTLGFVVVDIFAWLSSIRISSLFERHFRFGFKIVVKEKNYSLDFEVFWTHYKSARVFVCAYWEAIQLKEHRLYYLMRQIAVVRINRWQNEDSIL
jgi:hypothetical protein